MQALSTKIIASIALIFAGLVAPPAHAQQHGDLDRLRQHALSLVNEARRGHNLPPLSLDGKLNQAAQFHADDMYRRQYYSHGSPEGNTVADRYQKFGGSRWKLVAENIANCQGCPPPPDRRTVADLQEGWINSPEHRANILHKGLESFGFGIAMGEGRLYGVQTFAGPGASRGGGAGADSGQPVDAAEATVAAVDLINNVRRKENLPPVSAVEELRSAAQKVLPSGSGDSFEVARGALDQALPMTSATRWRSVGMLQSICGGCGAEPVKDDVRSFVEQWLGNPSYKQRLLNKGLGGIGLAIAADGEGKKIGVLIFGLTR